MPRYTCTDGFKGSLHVSNGFELLRGTQCNDVTLSNTLASDRRGNHGLPSKSSSESGPGPAGGPGAGHDGRDTLCVCPLHQHRPTLQPWLISQSGSSTSPHSCFQAVLQSRRRHPRNPTVGPSRRRHGWSGWRRRAGARRSTPATR